MDKNQKSTVARLSLRWHRAPMFQPEAVFQQLRDTVAGLPAGLSLVDGDDGAYDFGGSDEGFFYDLWVRHMQGDFDKLASAVRVHGIECEAEDESLIDEVEDTAEKRKQM